MIIYYIMKKINSSFHITIILNVYAISFFE